MRRIRRGTSPRRGRRQSGFSYIEVLVGIALLAIVAGGIAQGIVSTSAALGGSKADSTAHNLAQAQLDQAHRMPYDAVGLLAGSPPGLIAATLNKVVGPTTYRIVTDVQYVDDPALGQPHTFVNYKKVTVVVTPQVPGGKPVTQSTIVAPPNIGAIAGKATVIATVIDALTDQPVPGAPVTVDLGPSPTQTRSTDSQGRVVFAGLDPNPPAPLSAQYKYRLTVGLGTPWVTAPDSTPDKALQHLSASQAWETTLRVFKRATIQVNVRDSATGQPVSEPTTVVVTSAPPDARIETKQGATGGFTFTDIQGLPIQPSSSNFRVDVLADCYVPTAIERPVPTGYPASITETFDFSLSPVPHGELHVTVVDASTGAPIPLAQVQVSGGQQGLLPRVRPVDASGFGRFCLEPSGSQNYVVSATAPGYGAGSLLAVVLVGQVTPLTMQLVPSTNVGNVRLAAGGPNRLVRLQAVVGTYDASQLTNTAGSADFTGLSAGNYMAYIATGFSGGEPTWSAGKLVLAVAGQLLVYAVP